MTCTFNFLILKLLSDLDVYEDTNTFTLVQSYFYAFVSYCVCKAKPLALEDLAAYWRII